MTDSAEESFFRLIACIFEFWKAIIKGSDFLSTWWKIGDTGQLTWKYSLDVFLKFRRGEKLVLGLQILVTNFDYLNFDYKISDYIYKPFVNKRIETASNLRHWLRNNNEIKIRRAFDEFF